MLWQATEFEYSDGHRSSYRVYAGRVDLTDDDIVLGEGRAIVFVDPGRDTTRSTRPSRAPTSCRCSSTPTSTGSSPTKGPCMTAPRTAAKPRRIEVPAMGAEDVVVDDQGFAWTGTEDGSVWRVGTGRVGAQGRRHRRSPAGHRAVRRGPAPDRRRPRGPADDEHDDRCGRAPRHRGRRAADGLLQQRRRRRRTATSGSPTPAPSTRSRSGRPTSSRTPAPAGCCAGGRTAPSRCTSTASPSPTGSPWPSDESFVCVAETARRTVVRLWLRGERAGTTRPARRGPPRLPRQHRARQRRPDLGHDRLAGRPGRGAAARTRAAGGAQDGHPDPRARSSPSPSRPCGCRPSTTTGRLVHDIDADAGSYHMVTGVREHQGEVWLASLHEAALAVVSLPGVGV